MKTILEGWNVMRAIKLLLGLVILVQGIVAAEIITIIFGLVISGLAIANSGCCGAAGCSTDPKRKPNPLHN